MVAVVDKPPVQVKEIGPLRRALGTALGDVLSCLPALMLAWLCLRIAETSHVAGAVKVSILFGPALANDLLSLLRYGFLFVLGAPLLAPIPARRWRLALLGLCWSALLACQAGLIQYDWIAGVPLGADLFGYTRAEVATTVGGGWRVHPPLVVALLSALAVLWVALNACSRAWWPRAGARPALVAGAVSLLGFAVLPDHFAPPAAQSEASIDYLLNKTAYFADRNLAHLAGTGGAGALEHGKGDLPWAGKDPRYPFAHAERTPDTLGPLLERRPGAPPPNLVFIIVEGLGRTFSGPGARLGSFTPFLDELAGRSLYFENFLSGQGRTFGVLTTVFGSLPFGDNGLAALGDQMPRHASLLSVLKAQGYRLNFYSGSDLEFDNEGKYLRQEGVDRFVSERDYGPPAQRSNEWGYPDGDLVDMALRRQGQDREQAPAVSIIQTTSMHDPFSFPDKPRYLEKVGQRLAQLGIAGNANPGYAAQREIFASILYTDDALRRYFEGAAKLPGFENTIFIVTGDHRLPELPMDTRIERYHVPLIVYSPMLKAPRAVKAVSSQFDLAPSLLAYLSNNHGLQSPAQVSWLGTGLDTDTSFRNLHVIPLKQTKTELSDFISGSDYLAQGRLYALADGLLTDRAPDGKALATARSQFEGFLQANRVAGRAAALAPPAAIARLAPYRAEVRELRSVALAAEGGVGVAGVKRAAAPGPDGAAMIEATMSNQSTSTSQPFVPLLVISDAGGLEVGEAAGELQTLAPGATLKVALPAKLGKLPHGTYFVSMIPSHPETGRSIGIGQYHVEMKL
jgi:hypothetical protein